MRAVFDTNNVLSALIFGRRLSWLRVAWAQAQVTPLVCRETVAELLRTLAYPKFKLASAERDLLLAEYLPFAAITRLPEQLPPLPVHCRDPFDAPFIHLALSARADCLVSGDHDLMVLHDAAGVPILSVDALRRQMGS